jgi:hypothetical protein
MIGIPLRPALKAGYDPLAGEPAGGPPPPGPPAGSPSP